MKYDVNYFIAKFEHIPEAFWCVERLTFHDKHCALGHCGVNGGDDFMENREAASLQNLFSLLSIVATLLLTKSNR